MCLVLVSDNVLGNLSTIVKIVVLPIASGLGLDAVTSDALVGVAGSIVGLILALVDARYPNTFMDKSVEE